ncbi:gyf domain-containing protein [Xylariales sp. AK1849]|nr:gyf domain-containing protein [Xylariales sp. AK1849]
MPSNLPSSFASAAAGQNSTRDGRSGSRTDGRGNTSGEWPRTGRPNGTLTFRRPSTTPSSHQMNSADLVQPPATMAENAPQRYTRDQLLAIFDSAPQPDVSSLFLQGWNLGHVNGNSTATRGWGKSNDSHVQPQEPDLCWNASATTRPSNLRDMSAEEKELFSTDVNSPVKPPSQNKDAGGGLMNGRKTSVSHGASSNFSLASPSSASRPGTRRRETTDTNPYSGGGGLTSPTSATRPGREDSSFWLGRKNTEIKDSMFEEPEEDSNQRETQGGQNSSLPFGGPIRQNTASGASGLAATSSLWSQPTASSPSTSGAGAFGNFALPGTSAIGEKRPGGSQSRLAHLLPKDSNDSMGIRSNEPSSATDPGRSWRARPRTDTDPFGGGDDSLSGSAVLGGAQDTSPPPTTARNQMFDTPVKGSAGEFGMSGLNLGVDREHEHAPLSPSETNPYRSPPGERGENDDGPDRMHGHGLGLGGSEHVSGFGSGLPRAFGQAGFEGSDRSQTSSVGAKPYPPLNNLTGWPTSATPDRERNPFGGAFGNSLFGPTGDLHSPSLGNLGGIFGPTTTTALGASGSISRGSKLSSLLPPAMQSQMQGQDIDHLADSIPDLRQVNPLGAIGRNAFADHHARDTESPMRAGRGIFADMFNADPTRAPGTAEGMTGGIPAFAQPQGYPQSSGTPFSGTGASEPPSAQARSMVMPDRMRWVYLDPQGQQQGPFTGLEMNDWYKANFFTADLRVKKVEDTEFEPLGQLIRRIGNSREPFLVPMMGIPHGPPSQAGPFSPSTTGVVQPPLEQNDLERRKQEEHQQRIARVQLQGHPGLHHHSSAHSLQSQPSFGSMTSPIAMPPQPPIGPISGAAPFLGAQPQTLPIGPGNANNTSISELFRDEELARMSAEERQVLPNLRGPGPIGPSQPQPPNGGQSMESFRNRLPGTEELLEDDEGFRGRLQQFEQLRAQHDAHAEQMREAKSPEQTPSVSSPATRPTATPSSTKESVRQQKEDSHALKEAEAVSLNKQFEQAQAAATAKSGLPLPFPPPQSSTPLPAPAPQRVKSNLPEQYATSSRSETPDFAPTSATTQPPPLAPWAQNNATDSHRGPSLKEIQESEAKKAAKLEAAAAAQRRAMAEEEAAREREKVVILASGLPTTSIWGTTSPVNPAANSPWGAPKVPKGPAPSPAAPARVSDKKKTLADIQREEEAATKKVKESATQSGAAASAGKRYADLASKSSAVPVAPPPAAGWSTVGAGGKVKIPTGPSAVARSVSSTNVKASAALAPTDKPVTKSVGTNNTAAMDEFNKWVLGQLTRGNIGSNDINSFAQILMTFPPDANLIAEAIYGTSKTMNGQHFAAEFIRRKKLAEKGVIEKQTDVTAQSGGWNEVAKKTTHKEGGDSGALPAGFKVVSVASHDSASSGTSKPTEDASPKVEARAVRDEAIGLGSAALNAFLQANVTGPVLEGVSKCNAIFSSAYDSLPAELKPATKQEHSAIGSLRKICLRSLDIDGVSVYSYIPHIELFCIARWIFTSGDVFLTEPSRAVNELAGDLAWMRFRIHLWHYKLISQPSLGPGSLFTKAGRWTDVATLQELTDKSLEEAGMRVIRNDAASKDAKVQFLLEKANAHIMLGHDAKAKDAVRYAAKISGFVYALSEMAPNALQLNDDTLLEKISFTGDGTEDVSQSILPDALQGLTPENQPRLKPEDQIILLTEATLKDAFSPADSLTSEEILPFAVRVIEDKSTNWQIYTQALLVRSRIELNRSRTVERGVLQMQAVVDQVIVDTDASVAADTKEGKVSDTRDGLPMPTIEVSGVDNPTQPDCTITKPTSFFPPARSSESASPQTRLRYVNALSSPPRWHLESELAYAWASVGSLVSSLEIFKRLRLWPEVALCLASSAATGDEDGRGSGGEEKARAIVRWRLFRRTDVSTKELDGDDDGDNTTVDTDTLKSEDYRGPERDPPPPNAPRLFCILGDMENEPAHYSRAWEISKRRFGRAQKSLGELHLQKKEWAKAREAYKLAVGVNRLSPDLWGRLGDIELRLGCFPDAAEAFQRAIGASNGEEGGEGARTWSNLGTALLSWHRECAKEQMARKEKEKSAEETDGTHTTGNGEIGSFEDTEMDITMPATARAAALNKPPHRLLQDALTAFKRGATIASSNWRIWDNVVTLAASLSPEPAIDDVVSGTRNVLRIRNSEEGLDDEVLSLLLRKVLEQHLDAGDGIYNPPRGSIPAKVVTLFEDVVVPLITMNSGIWALVSRLRAWRRDYAGALDAAEKGWRAAMGSSTASSSLSASTATTGGIWQTGENKQAWDVVVSRTEELVAAYENWGPLVEGIGEGRWKGKARSAIRSVMGRGKECWEGTDGWQTLESAMEDLRAR